MIHAFELFTLFKHIIKKWWMDVNVKKKNYEPCKSVGFCEGYWRQILYALNLTFIAFRLYWISVGVLLHNSNLHETKRKNKLKVIEFLKFVLLSFLEEIFKSFFFNFLTWLILKTIFSFMLNFYSLFFYFDFRSFWFIWKRNWIF